MEVYGRLMEVNGRLRCSGEHLADGSYVECQKTIGTLKRINTFNPMRVTKTFREVEFVIRRVFTVQVVSEGVGFILENPGKVTT